MKNALATKTLITLLVLLQSIAPLVHAHLGLDSSPPGVHMPGLEFANFSPDSEHGRFLKSASTKTSLEGMVVGISAGANHHDWPIVDSDRDESIPSFDLLDSQGLSSITTARSPPRQWARRRYFHFPASPRAPPHR